MSRAPHYDILNFSFDLSTTPEYRVQPDASTHAETSAPSRDIDGKEQNVVARSSAINPSVATRVALTPCRESLAHYAA